MNECISIIVPVYKQDNTYLEECLSSLVQQTYKNIEIIIVNDGATKENLELIENFKDERIVVIGKDNCGVSHARNLGIQHAKGQWITFVDSDDYIEPNGCQIMFDKAKKLDVDVLTCSIERVSGTTKTNIQCTEEDSVYSSIDFINKMLNVQNSLGFCWGKLWKASVIKDHDIMFDESLVVAEDCTFCIQVLSKGAHIGVITDCLYGYRLNQNSVSKKYDTNYCEKYQVAIYKIHDTLKDIDLLKNKMIDQNYSNFVAYHLLMIASNYSFNPDNQLSYRNQKSLEKEIVRDPLFSHALSECNYNDLSMTRKISLFCLKHKMYYALSIICRVRHKQVSK